MKICSLIYSLKVHVAEENRRALCELPGKLSIVTFVKTLKTTFMP